MFEKIQDFVSSENFIPILFFVTGVGFGYWLAPDNAFGDHVDGCMEGGYNSAEVCFRAAAEHFIDAMNYHQGGY